MGAPSDVRFRRRVQLKLRRRDGRYVSSRACAVIRSVGLEEVCVPELLVPEEQPVLPPAEYKRRLDALRRRVSADAIVVYADREHFANLAFFSGFDPRFEEAILVL